MKKVNVIRVAFDEIDKVVNDVRKQRIALEEKLDLLIEKYDLKWQEARTLFRGCSIERLCKIAETLLPNFSRADLMLEVLELKLLHYAKELGVDTSNEAFVEELGSVRDARIRYIDGIAGKIWQAFDREMKPYRKLGGLPLFEDC